MEYKSKIITTEEEFLSLVPLVKVFPIIHNKLKDDMKVLINITEVHKEDVVQFQTLCRACIKNLFSIIEADLYHYNLFDSYKDYSDKDDFIKKFKKTFKQICNTWQTEELQKQYFDTKFQMLRYLRIKRDAMTHPKKIDHILEPTIQDFNHVKSATDAYIDFINEIMKNFSIQYLGKDDGILAKLGKVLNE